MGQGKAKEWGIRKKEFKVMKEWNVSLNRLFYLTVVVLMGRARSSQKEWMKKNEDKEKQKVSQDRNENESRSALKVTLREARNRLESVQLISSFLEIRRRSQTTLI